MWVKTLNIKDLKMNNEIINKKKDWSKPFLRNINFKKTAGGGPDDPPEDDYYNPVAS